MFNIFKILLIISSIIGFSTYTMAKENFFNEAKKNFDQKNLEKSKFLFQKNIVFNPKDAQSYLYLAKIYNAEENPKEELKNLNTTLILEPDNEEAIFMMIKLQLEKSNYSKVKDLTSDLKIVRTKFCKEIKNINQSLKNIEPKNDTQ